MSARNITLTCILIAIIGGIGSYIWYRHHVEELFFSHALASAGVTAPANASPGSLELLYAQTMAIRSPLFGIVGTDPEDLADAVSALATTTQELASAQPTSQDVQIVQNDLYPIDFLRSLATTEADREAFVENGTAQNEQAYDAALRVTASAGIADSEAFDSGLETEIGTSTFTLDTMGYPITSGLLLQAASDTVSRMKYMSSELTTRDACVSGGTSSCNNADIALPSVVPTAASPSSAPLPELSSAVLSTVSAASPPGFFSGSQIVRLDSSVCLDAYTGSYLIDIQPGSVDPRARYTFIGDLFFTKLPTSFSEDIPFAKTYDITYLNDDPLEFYQCPETESDLSAARAILSTAQFAQQHPELAPEDVVGLDGQVDDEGYARNYITDALSQPIASSTEKTALISLAVEFNEGDADLATVVGEISILEKNNLEGQQAGTLLNETGLNTLFFTHSGFLSLFLASSPSSTPPVSSIRDKAPGMLALYPYVTSYYSTLRQQVPENKIVHDLEAGFDFETGQPPPQ